MGWGVRVTLFLSTVVNKVDKKGRVSVPAAWRTVLAAKSFPGIVAFPSYTLDAIEGCDVDRMAEMSDRHDTLDQFSEERESLASIFAHAHQLAFDGEGRIVLPEKLLAHSHITEAAAFVGQGRTFQIWEPERWSRHASEMLQRLKSERATLPGSRAAAGGAA